MNIHGSRRTPSMVWHSG